MSRPTSRSAIVSRMLDSQLAPGPVPPGKAVNAAFVAAALEATGVSQSELARRLGAAFTTVNRWVNGHATISRARWMEVTQALGLPLEWKPGDPVPPSAPV